MSFTVVDLSPETQTRLGVANQVLAAFTNSRIERRKSGWYVCWENKSQGEMARRWQCRGQDFYPVWYRKWCHGGTASTALSQLVRWLQEKPVLPISSWRYWAGDACKLLDVAYIEVLLAGGYPEKSTCVLCGRLLGGSLDWWSLDDVSGPCCHYTQGCRQVQEGKL